MSSSPPYTLLFWEPCDTHWQVLKEQLDLYPEFTLVRTSESSRIKLLLDQEKIDLLVFDLNLDEEGTPLLPPLSPSPSLPPIVALFPKAISPPKIATSISLIEDYLLKPFRFLDFLRHLRAHLSAPHFYAHPSIEMEGIRLEPHQREFINTKGEHIRLTEKETNILWLLLQTPNQTVSKETLLRKVWGYQASLLTHTLETHIYRLRQKVDIYPDIPPLLCTEEGGYKIRL